MDKEKYKKFIEGLQLKSIRLRNIEAKLRYPNFSRSMRVDSDIITEYQKEGNVLNADVTMRLSFKDVKTRRVMAKVNVTLNLEYTFTEEPTEEMLKVFEESSLLINAWPYFRFWTQTITQSFGWPPFVMPLLKALPETPENKHT